MSIIPSTTFQLEFIGWGPEKQFSKNVLNNCPSLGISPGSLLFSDVFSINYENVFVANEKKMISEF